MADQAELPENQESFKLNEVCKLANVQPYMLRFWGTEFAQLEAAKSGTGQRLYTRDQVTVILEIRRLLFDEGLTIAGARKKIASMQDKGALPTPEVGEISDKEPAVEDVPARATDSDAAPAEAPSAAKGKGERKAPPKPTEVEDAVVMADAGRVQPLLATLKDVRTEVAKIVEELKTDS
jgi:DNA-binding transcriptional MerR regulator